MYLPIPFPYFKMMKRYNLKLAEIMLNNRLDTVLLSTLTEKKYTPEEVMAFLLGNESSIKSLFVFRKWHIYGIMKYTIEEYTKNDGILSVNVQEVERSFYESMVRTFNM